MRDILEFTYPVIPPTSNKLYFRGTMLTEVARKYAEDFSKFMMQNHGAEILEMDKTSVYALHLRFFFTSLENAKWNDPKCPPSKRPKTRYKRLDLSNRIKLLEDCIRDALDIDDAQTFAASQEKHQVRQGEPERVEIIIQRTRPGLFGLGE
jgi:Holliday junction resolvase RusA-like endonuclease